MGKKRTSERFGNVRKKKSTSSEDFGTLPYVSERTSEHILSVREVAKRFENAGVPRTERSIINWCQPNPQGMSRLDCFFDTNEGKYFITPISVDRAISEERNRLKIQDQTPSSETAGNSPETTNRDSERFGKEQNSFGTFPKRPDDVGNNPPHSQSRDVEVQIRDLQIMNKAKDMYIERLETSNDKLIEELKNASHQLGELRTQIRQLEAPKEDSVTINETKENTGDAEEEENASAEVVKPEDGKAEASSGQEMTKDTESDEPVNVHHAESSDYKESNRLAFR